MAARRAKFKYQDIEGRKGPFPGPGAVMIMVALRTL
jgi:hypothetical protein